MPNDAALVAASNAAVASTNALSSANLNRRNRKFAEEMYNRQRSDALSDWERQNEYNSPAAQMQRFKEAGLNPNLVFGQSNASGPIDAPDFKPPDTQAPRWGDALGSIAQYMDSMYNFEMKQAQTDNLRAQNAVIQQDALLRAAQIRDVTGSANRKEFDLELDSVLRQTSIDARKEALRQLQTSTDLSIREDVRRELMNSSNLKEANERIQNLIQERSYKKVQMAHTNEDRKRIIEETARIKKSVDLMMKEGVIKDLDVELSKAGVRGNDPIWYRSLGLIINGIVDQFR